MATSAFFLLLVNLISVTGFRPASIYRNNVETSSGRKAFVLWAHPTFVQEWSVRFGNFTLQCNLSGSLPERLDDGPI
jgi:hypothetical protein